MTITLDATELAGVLETGGSFCTTPDTYLAARKQLGLEVEQDDPYEPPVKAGCGGKED